MTWPAVAACQIVAPVTPLSAQIDPPEPTRVPSSTWSWPLPRMSARAGLLVVVPSSFSIQRGVQWALTSITSLVVDAPPIGGAGAEDDPDAPTELTDGRRGLDGLIGVVLADQAATGVPRAGVAGGAEHPDVAAVGVVRAVGETGRGVAAFDDVGPAVAVDVAQGGGGEVAVGLEPREAREHGSVGRVHGLADLTERAGDDVGAAAEVADRHRRLHRLGRRGVGGRVLHVGEPLGGALGGDAEVSARGRGGRVAFAHEDRVEAAPGGVGHRRGGVDGHAAVFTGHPGTRRARGQVEGVHVAGAVADHDRATPGQGGHVGRRQGDRAAGVVERLGPDQREGRRGPAPRPGPRSSLSRTAHRSPRRPRGQTARRPRLPRTRRPLVAMPVTGLLCRRPASGRGGASCRRFPQIHPSMSDPPPSTRPDGTFTDGDGNGPRRRRTPPRPRPGPLPADTDAPPGPGSGHDRRAPVPPLRGRRRVAPVARPARRVGGMAGRRTERHHAARAPPTTGTVPPPPRRAARQRCPGLAVAQAARPGRSATASTSSPGTTVPIPSRRDDLSETVPGGGDDGEPGPQVVEHAGAERVHASRGDRDEGSRRRRPPTGSSAGRGRRPSPR